MCLSNTRMLCFVTWGTVLERSSALQKSCQKQRSPFCLLSAMKPLPLGLACLLLVSSCHCKVCWDDSYLLARDAWDTLEVPSDGSLRLENFLRCVWHIQAREPGRAVLMRLQRVDLELLNDRCIDSLTLTDSNGRRLGVYCNLTEQRLVSSIGSSLQVMLQTDINFPFGRFTLSYKQVSGLPRVETTVRPPCQNDIFLEASAAPQYLQSTGYPALYPGSLGCLWTITTELQNRVISVVVNDTVLDDSPGCTSDHVSAYNGFSTASWDLIRRWCGTQRPSFSSSGPSLTLAFHSSASQHSRGFRLMYSAVVESADSRTTTVVVSIFGCMLVAGVLLLICLMWKRYRIKLEDPYNRPSTDSNQATSSSTGTTGVYTTSSSRQLHLSTPPALQPTPSSYSPPPYPDSPAPPLGKDDPPPYWMAAAYEVDPSTLHGGRKQDGHVGANGTSGHAQDAGSVQESSAQCETRL